MFTFSGTIYSDVLQMCTGLTVSLPTNFSEDVDGKLPVLYLLHGLSDNHSCWVRRSNIDHYAQQAGIAVIMPEVQRSFYADMKYGLDYYTYISQELPKICKKLFPITHDAKRTFIAGLSMGGYGAMKIGLSNPNNFGGIASFSGCLDIVKRIKEDVDVVPFKERIGINNDKISSGDNLLCITEKLVEENAEIPPLYITCGLDDFLFEDNQNFRKHIERLKINFVYEEWAGAHEWAFWDKSVHKALQFFLGGECFKHW